jgi:hypothetical protein
MKQLHKNWMKNMSSSLRRTLPRKRERESATEESACVCVRARAGACVSLFVCCYCLDCSLCCSVIVCSSSTQACFWSAIPVWEANVPALKNAGDIKWQKIRSCLLACLDSLSQCPKFGGDSGGNLVCQFIFKAPFLSW